MSKKTQRPNLILLLCIIVLAGCGAGGGPTNQTTAAAAVGTAALSWPQATTYTDNSALTPSGYKVYYGTAHNTYTTVIDLPVANLSNPTSPNYTVSKLPRGTYYFAVAVYDAAHTESALSTEVSKVIR